MSLLAVGVDQAWDRATPADLIAYGASFVCRYLGEDTSGKNLTANEAGAYIAAGLAIVSNYEYLPNVALGGYNAGVRCAQLASAQHRACGGPADRPIYFSVDFYTDAASMPAVLNFFRGVVDTLGLARSGAYGSYTTIRGLFDAGLITYGWQTYAWSGTPTQWEPRAQLRQVANGITIAGHNVDRDEAYAPDYGQWGVPMTQPAGLTPTEYTEIVEGGMDAHNALFWWLRSLADQNDAALTGTPMGKPNHPGLAQLAEQLAAIANAVAQPAAAAAAGFDYATLAAELVKAPGFVTALQSALGGLKLAVQPF